VDFLSNFNPADLQKYFKGVDFPLNKGDVVQVAQDNGAPQPLVDQLQNRLPEGQFSNPQEIIQALQR
jgi:hypothetical protein